MGGFLFVYGTLRRDLGLPVAAVLAEAAEYRARAFMQGRLYALEGYPGVVESCLPEDKVVGDLYHILQPEALFATLDDYEECSASFVLPHEYVRKRVPVWPDDGLALPAWCYVYNRDVGGRQRIVSGDYLAWSRGRDASPLWGMGLK